RLSSPANTTQQRNVHNLERGDLICRCVQLLEEIHRRTIERGGKPLESLFFRYSPQRRVPLPRRIGFRVQVVKRTIAPQGPFDPKVLLVAPYGYRVGSVGLKLNRVRARPLCSPDRLDGSIETVIVIGRDFGNNVDRVPRPDSPTTDVDRTDR